jgi:hypothetical protein
LEVLDLRKQELGGSLNVFLKMFFVFVIEFLRQQLDKSLHISNKLLLVKSRLLLKISTNQTFYQLLPQNLSFNTQKTTRDIQQIAQETHLEPKRVNNVNHLDSLVINTFILIASFSRRISANVYVDSSLNNPLNTNQLNINNLRFTV